MVNQTDWARGARHTSEVPYGLYVYCCAVLITDMSQNTVMEKTIAAPFATLVKRLGYDVAEAYCS